MTGAPGTYDPQAASLTHRPQHTLTSILARYEPWLVLLAGPVLVFREWFAARLPGAIGSGWRPGPLEWLALGWIGLLWLIRYWERGRWTIRTALDLPIIALLLTVPGAVLVAMDQSAALSRAESLLFAIALYYALANAVDTPARAWSAVTWLMVAGLGLVAVGLVSVGWIEKYPALTPFLSRLPRLVHDIPHPNANLQTVGVHPNTLGLLLALFVPLAAAILLWPTGTRAVVGMAPPPWTRNVAILTLVVSGPVLVLTQARAAWLALAATLWLLASIRRPTWLAVGGGAALAGPALAASVGWWIRVAQARPSTLTFPGSTSVLGRINLWREAANLLATQPYTGIGLDNFPLVHGFRPEYEGYWVFQGAAHVHNVLLQAALDFGVPGFVAVAGLAVTLAWVTYRAHRRLNHTPLDPVVIGLAGSLLVYALHGLVDAMAIGAKTGFVVWAMAGLLVGVREKAHRWVNAPGVPVVGDDGAAAVSGSLDVR